MRRHRLCRSNRVYRLDGGLAPPLRVHEQRVYTLTSYAWDWGGHVRARDWTALIKAGGHLQAVLKIAATVGQNLWHVGAHNAGVPVEEMLAAGWPLLNRTRLSQTKLSQDIGRKDKTTARRQRSQPPLPSAPMTKR